MDKRTCSIDGCNRDATKRSMCGMHYLRWWKSGTAGSAQSFREQRAEARQGLTCPAEGCGNSPKPGGIAWCELHYGRIRRNGDPYLVVDMRKPDASYRAAHSRIERDRGPAAGHECVDCGVQAQHWSYDHTDPHEIVSRTGQPYSLDTARYAPRCVACHWDFDHAMG